MFVEVYVPYYNRAEDIGGTPTAMTTLNKVVNVEMLETISLIPIAIDGKNYYKISLMSRLKDELSIDRMYVTESDWQRLLH